MQRSKPHAGKQLCYLTSVAAISVEVTCRSRNGFATPIVAMASSMNRDKSSAKVAVNDDRLVPRLCTFPAPKAK